MNKLIPAALAFAVTSAAFGQNLLTDRNFQRLDHVTHDRVVRSLLKTTSRSHYWQASGFTTQPDWNRSYGASITYADVPNGSSSDDPGYHEFLATTSFTHLDQKGGITDNVLGETLSYQLTGDASVGQLSAFTVGLQYSYIDEFNNTAVPSLSASYQLTSEFAIIPTVSSFLLRQMDVNTNGGVPDVEVLWTPKGSLSLGIDYVAATAINGPATAQLSGKWSLTSSGLTSLKAEATWSSAYRPAFTGVFAYKF